VGGENLLPHWQGITRDEAVKIIKMHIEKIMNLLDKKGADYGDEENYIQNFIQVAQLKTILGFPETPYSIWLTHVLTKLQRLSNLIKKARKPRNEAMTDSADDLTGYSLLLLVILEAMDRELQKME